MSGKLTDTHLEEIEAKGYVIVPEYYSGSKLHEMQAAQRRVLPTWEDVKDNPPPNRVSLAAFPSSEMVLLRGIVDHQAWAFARKWLKPSGMGICAKVAQNRAYPLSRRPHGCSLSRF